MSMTVLFISFLVLEIHVFKVSADEFELALYTHLMRSYNKDIRPTPDYVLPTNVTFGYSLHQVVNVILITSSWLNINWLDYRLSWNRSEFGGLDTIHIPAELVWKPDVMLFNNADPYYKDRIVSTEVYINDEGNTTWLAFGIFHSSCQINVRYYPFDDQECILTYSSWSYDMKEINITTISEEGDASNFVTNGEWELLSIKAQRHIQHYTCCDNPWPIINIAIQIRRRPMFYVFNHIMPCSLITSMALLGFYIPVESGEKVTMCITTMLSMGVFLNAIYKDMPPNSESLPLIGMYYIICFAIVCCAAFANVLTLNIHNTGRRHSAKSPPNWMKKLVLGFMAKMLFLKFPAPDPEEGSVNENRSGGNLNSASSNFRERQSSSTEALHAIMKAHAKPRPSHTAVNPGCNKKAFGLSLDETKTINGKQTPSTKSGTQNTDYRSQSPQLTLERIKTIFEIESQDRLNSYTAPVTASKCASTNSISSAKRVRFLVDEQQTTPTATDSIHKRFEKSLCRVMWKVDVALEQSNYRQALEDRRQLIMWEWKTLTTIVDRFLLILFLISLTTMTALLLIEQTLRQLLLRTQNDNNNTTASFGGGLQLTSGEMLYLGEVY